MKLYEVIIHTKLDRDKPTEEPKILFDDKVWGVNEMAVGMKALTEAKAKQQDINPDKIEVLIRPF